LDELHQQNKESKGQMNDMLKLFEEDIYEKQYRSLHLISQVQLYGPLNIGGRRYRNIDDDEDDQMDYKNQFVHELRDYLREKYDGELFTVEVFDEVFFENLFLKQLMKDTSWAILSIIFVVCVFIVHLRSVFLAMISMMLIIFSVPLTAMITEGVLGVTFFGQMQMSIVFIICGVSADDIFVFMDAWRQSKNFDPDIIHPDDKKRRMAYTFRRASRAMLFTSSTTSAAFIINAFSAVMPLKAFGIFAAVIVIVNFLEAAFVFPTALLFYEQNI